jgi:hypothetical protein
VKATADQYVEVWTDNPYWLTDGAHTALELAAVTPPRYDTDWSATGPEIERFKLDVWHVPADMPIPGMSLRWRATCERAEGSEEGDTPLIAICNLILALHAAGKLDLGKATK